jgi:hypothetical protein
LADRRLAYEVWWIIAQADEDQAFVNTTFIIQAQQSFGGATHSRQWFNARTI